MVYFDKIVSYYNPDSMGWARKPFVIISTLQADTFAQFASFQNERKESIICKFVGEHQENIGP